MSWSKKYNTHHKNSTKVPQSVLKVSDSGAATHLTYRASKQQNTITSCTSVTPLELVLISQNAAHQSSPLIKQMHHHHHHHRRQVSQLLSSYQRIRTRCGSARASDNAANQTNVAQTVSDICTSSTMNGDFSFLCCQDPLSLSRPGFKARQFAQKIKGARAEMRPLCLHNKGRLQRQIVEI